LRAARDASRESAPAGGAELVRTRFTDEAHVRELRFSDVLMKGGARLIATREQ
jgi:hypothetical protein